MYSSCQIEFDYQNQTQTSLNQDDIIEKLTKWHSLPKKSKKQNKWNHLYFQILKLVMPELEFNQIFMENSIFVEKLHDMMTLCKLKQEPLFNGIQIKVNEIFISFTRTQSLEKVLIQGSQIKEMTPLSVLSLIKKNDISLVDKKQKLIVYNRQKLEKTFFMIYDSKLMEKVKSDILRLDYAEKYKFMSSYLLGQHCPSYCISGLRAFKIKENQIFGQRNFNQHSLFIIYKGNFVCHFSDKNKSPDAYSPQFCKTKRLPKQIQDLYLHRLRSDDKGSGNVKKLQLSNGSILEVGKFDEVLETIGIESFMKIQFVKAIESSIVFEINLYEFIKVLNHEAECRRSFQDKYSQILSTRKQIITQFQNTLNLLYESHNCCLKTNISLERRKNYGGFRKLNNHHRASHSSGDMRDLFSIDSFDVIMKNKQKVLQLKQEYQSRRVNSVVGPVKQKDVRKVKENYRRLLVKNLQIKKIAQRNSVSSLQASRGMAQIKTKLNQVRGIFEDRIEQVQRLVHAQRTPRQQKSEGKMRKRNGIRVMTASAIEVNTGTLSMRDSLRNLSLNSARSTRNSVRHKASRFQSARNSFITQIQAQQQNFVEIFMKTDNQLTQFKPMKCIKNGRNSHRQKRRSMKKSSSQINNKQNYNKQFDGMKTLIVMKF